MKKLFVAISVAAVLSGCQTTSKGKQEFDTATQLAAADQYEEAINFLEQAVDKNPNNRDYVAKLNQLKTTFINEQSEKFQQLLSSNVTNGALTEATEILSKLTEVGLSSDMISSFTSQLESTKEQLYSALSDDYEDAQFAFEQGDLGKSYTLFQSIDERFANYEDVPLKLSSIKKTINQEYLKKANAAIKADDFETANELLATMLQVNPKNNIARGLLARVKKNNTPEYFAKKAQTMMLQEQWQDAINACDKVLAMNANNSECLLVLEQAKLSLSKQEAADFAASLNGSKLYAAKTNLDSIIKSSMLSSDEISSMVEGFSQKADFVASSYIERGKYGIAWNLLTSIQALNPGYPEIFTKIRDVEDSIIERAKRSVAVFDFGSPTGNNDAGGIVSNNLRSRLFNSVSNDINILEREALNSILEEMKLSQIGVVSESTAKEMGRVYGIDYAIMGSVLLYKVDENNSSSTQTIRYQTGEKISDNIDYLNWKAANPKPSKQELASAPQAKILVPEYSQVQYEVNTSKKVGFIQLSYRIVDVLTGENTDFDTIERKRPFEDSSNAGVAEAGVQFDPMEIPTDTEILQILTEEVVEAMASNVLKPLQQLETFYFNQGQDSEKRSEIENAVEYYTYALFNERVKSVSSSPISREAQIRIDALLADHVYSE